MAGEWLKFDSSTPEKKEVFSITVQLGWDDPDLTVGKLMKVWRWFDQHTIDGNADSVTPALLDRLIGVTGLTQAMANVGWMVITDTGLHLPHFNRHNGKTAKDRALGAKRAANYRSSDESNADSVTDTVTDALPREEKRREEKNKDLKTKTKTFADARSFESFWKLYPKKAAKGDAEKAWKKIEADVVPMILEAVEANLTGFAWTNEGGRYIPNPATWLNGKRWNDEVRPALSQSPAAMPQRQPQMSLDDQRAAANEEAKRRIFGSVRNAEVIDV